MKAARQQLSQVPGRDIRIFNPGEMMSMGGTSGFEFELRGRVNLVRFAWKRRAR